MKNERTKLLFLSLCLTILFIFITIIISFVGYNKYKTSVNNYLYSVIETLKTKYPEITEIEIAKLLNETTVNEFPSILKKYGIEENIPVLASLEKNYHTSLFLNITIVIAFSLLFSFYFFWYFLKKEKRLREITNYMKEINKRNYFLGISDNEEGELSILQNEVYKTTIMLREESENLKKEKASLKDLISDISHQLKTPLTSILIMLDNIIDNPKMDEKTRTDFISNVEHQVENIRFLLVSLLKLSRLDAGIVVFKKEKIDLEKLLLNVIKNVEILKEVKNIKIDIEVPKKINFMGDYNWQLEALTNILKNAIEHSYDSGIIKITAEENALFYEIFIEDYGSGMSKKDLNNIFKRFYKGENSSSDSIGIGMPLAKKIIEQDNGLIKVKSKIKEGTVFEIKYRK